MKNNLLADNNHRYGTSLPVNDDCAGPVFSLGYNLVEESLNCALSGTSVGFILGQDPKLGPLTSNGGLTKTKAPLTGSPAVNSGEQPSCLDGLGIAIPSDQRGVLRPQAGICDIGAYEVATRTIARSLAIDDGWILELSENSGTGGTIDSSATTMLIGDNASKKQFLSILSFNSGPLLPDNAIIVSARLRVQFQGTVGSVNPLTLFKGFMVDIKKGFFGTTKSLQSMDFESIPGITVGPLTPALTGGWYNLDLTRGKNFINKLLNNAGLTQIRLRFQLDDNNDAIANYLSLFCGNAPLTSRPQLVIEYYIP